MGQNDKITAKSTQPCAMYRAKLGGFRHCKILRINRWCHFPTFFFIAEPFNNIQTNVMKRYQTVTTFAHGKCFDNFVILSLGLSVQCDLFNKSEKDISSWKQSNWYKARNIPINWKLYMNYKATISLTVNLF